MQKRGHRAGDGRKQPHQPNNSPFINSCGALRDNITIATNKDITSGTANTRTRVKLQRLTAVQIQRNAPRNNRIRTLRIILRPHSAWSVYHLIRNLNFDPEKEVRTSFKYFTNLLLYVTNADTVEAVHEEVLKTQSKKKLNSDEKARDQDISVDDEVLLLLPTSKNKLLLQ